MHRFIRIASLYLLVLLFGQVRAQNQQKADSILSVIESNTLTAAELLEAYYWASTYSTSPIDELSYSKQLLSLAEKANNQEYIIKAKLRIGVANRLMGNLSLALTALFDAAEQASSNDGLKSLLIEIYPEIASCYTQNGDTDNSLRYDQKTIEILRGTDRKQDLALNLLNLGYNYYLNEEYQKAIDCYDESEPLLQAIGLTIGEAYIIGNRALVFWKKGDLEKAKKDLLVAIEMLGPLDDQYGMADYYNQLAAIHLEENDVAEAKTHALSGLTMASDNGFKEQIRDANNVLFQVYEQSGNHELSNAYQQQYHLYKDSIHNLKTTQQIADLRAQFEVGQKQAEVDLLLEQKRNNRVILIFTVLVIFILLSFSLLIYRNAITRKKLNQKLEEQKDALIALNDTKDKFFSIISHDLRSPATRFQGLASVVKKEYGNLDQTEFKQLLSYLEISALDLSKLLENLLDWAEQQEGHFPYEPETYNIRALLNETSGLHRDMLKAKKIDLELIVENDKEIFVDKNSTCSIFRNLFSNAIKFTPEGGTIKVEGFQNGSQDFATLKFIDNGVGISDDKIQSLTKSESGLSTDGTAGEKGLGLGLQLVRDFVVLNKGKFDIASEEGKGTVVTVQLPTKAI